jgi:hypothetical protein
MLFKVIYGYNPMKTLNRKYCLKLFSIFLYCLLPGCEKDVEKGDIDFMEVKPIPVQEFAAWKKRNWTFIIPTISHEKYSDINTYDPISDNTKLLIGNSSYLYSVAVGKTLDPLAYAHEIKGRNTLLEIYEWPHNRSRLLYSPPYPHGVFSLSWSPNEKLLAFLVGPLSCENPSTTTFLLYILEPVTGKYKDFGKISCWVSSKNSVSGSDFLNCPLVWSQNGKSLYYATGNMELMKVDIEAGKSKKVGQACIPVREEGDKILVFMEKPLRLQEISLVTGQVRTFFSVGGVKGVGRCIVSPDGKIFGIGCTKIYFLAYIFFDSEKKILGLLPVKKPILGWCEVPNEIQKKLKKSDEVR